MTSQQNTTATTTTTPTTSTVCPKQQAKSLTRTLHFLENPDLAKISRIEKITFLKEKGVSKDIIDKAFQAYDKKMQILEFHNRFVAEAQTSKEIYERLEQGKREAFEKQLKK